MITTLPEPIKEHELVETTTPVTIMLPEGTVGVIVDHYERESGLAYEVEIVLGPQVFVVTLDADQVKPI